MTEDDLREAWKRRKEELPLEPKHLEAERAYNTAWRDEMSRVSIPAAVRKRGEKVAQQRGVTFPQFVLQLVELAAANAIIERAPHDAIVAEHQKKIMRLERLHDDLREQAADSAGRVRSAEDAAALSVEELFLLQERLISILDFMGAPEPERGQFLALTGTAKPTEGGDAEA